MVKQIKRNEIRKRRHARIRRKISGTHEIPRLVVFRSNKHIAVQLIDDTKGVTLGSASSLAMKLVHGDNVESAAKVGTEIANVAKNLGITKVVFDRGGYLYHGRIKALADAARKAGLEF